MSCELVWQSQSECERGWQLNEACVGAARGLTVVSSNELDKQVVLQR